MPAPDRPAFGLYHYQSAELHVETEQRQLPPGTEFINRLGLVDAYEARRNQFMFRYPNPRTMYWLFAGRHGAGKSSALSEIEQMAANDVVLAEWIERQGLPPLRIKSFPLASALDAAKEEGSIDPKKPHGSYDPLEYRAGSRLQYRLVGARSNNYEGPEWDLIEISGPSVFRNSKGELQRKYDRGYTVGEGLARHYQEETQVYIIDRDQILVDKIAQTRQKVADCRPEELPGVLADGNINIARAGQILKLDELSPDDLFQIQESLKRNASASEGMKRGNLETDLMRRDLTGGDNEQEMWHAWMETMGFSKFDYMILPNPATSQPITLHIDLSRQSDAIRDYEEWLRSLKGGRKRTPRFPHP